MLTNFKTVKQSIKRLNELQLMQEDGSLDKLTKKEGLNLTRELDKLERSIGGIKSMASLPDAIFVIDVGYENGAIEEAAKLGIPIIGIVDTNNSIENINYVIPGNDDSSRAIRLYARGMADAILDGKNQAINDLAKMVSNEKEDIEQNPEVEEEKN
jgi:small subunit ribosomal protein S2